MEWTQMNIFRGESYFKEDRFPFYIDRYVIGKEETVPLHSHDFVELVYVVSGSALHEMSGNRYPLSAGEVFILEPQAYHSYSGSETEETVVYNVLFDVEFLRNELDALKRMPSFVDFFYLAPFLRKTASFIPYSALKDTQNLLILDHLRTIHEEFVARKEGYQLIIKTRWIECLVLLGRFHQENLNARRRTLTDKERMESIRHFVDQNFREPLTLEQLSRICGMSVSSFTAKFRETMGVSLIDYKHELQVQRARSQLAETRNKILEIALEAGFNDISFFNKVFRKHTGLTPNEFRKGVQSKSM
jgi:AraC-like DNA-binding protein/quercetin dioxygenase-like cupin family protein